MFYRSYRPWILEPAVRTKLIVLPFHGCAVMLLVTLHQPSCLHYILDFSIFFGINTLAMWTSATALVLVGTLFLKVRFNLKIIGLFNLSITGAVFPNRLCVAGTYESGIASYKHLYFNATGNTLKIWFLTVGAVILLYECVRQLTFLGLRCRLRLSMTVLFLSSLFSHYYSW